MMTMTLRGIRAVVIASLALVTAIGFAVSTHVNYLVAAQTEAPSPSPTPDEEKDRLQREADLATLKKTKAVADKDAAEARKAELEARFPKPTTSPLEGKTTVDGAVIESQMVSYISLSRAADRVVERIKAHFRNNENLTVYNEQDVNLILNYKVATSQVDTLVSDGYCRILTSTVTNNLCPKNPAHIVHIGAITPQAVLPIASSFLGAFVDFTALLRTNVDIKGQTFAIDEAPLVAEIFRSAKGKDPFYGQASKISKEGKNEKNANHSEDPCEKVPGFCKPGNFYYPYVFPPDINLDRGSELLERLEKVHRLRGDASQIIDATQKDSDDIEKLTANIKDLQKTLTQTLPKQSAEAVGLAGTLIQANCRRLSPEVAVINELPQQNQSDAMVRLIAKVSKSCPKIDSDKLAQILGLSNVLTDTAKAVNKAKKDLGDAKTDEQNAETDLAAQLAKLNLDLKPPTTPTERKDAATAAVAQLKQVNTQFDNLVASLLQSQSGTANPLTNFIKVERLNAALFDGGKDNYWLQVKVINAGGNNRTKTNLLVDIFTGGNRLSHSGGVIVEYHLFSSDGKSVESGTVADYTDYIKADKIRERTGSSN